MIYSLIGFVAILVHLIVNLSVLRKKGNLLLPIERSYKLFLVSVIGYHITDALWGVIYDQRIRLLTFINTELYFIAMAIAVFLWTRFVISYLQERNIFTKLLNIIGIIFCILQVVAVVINIYSPILFDIDSDAEYHTGHLRNVSLIVQIFMFIITSLYTLFLSRTVNGKVQSRHRTVGFFGIAMTLPIIIQTFYPFLPMYTVGYLLGCCVLHAFVLEDAKAEYRAKHDRLTDLPNPILLGEELPEIMRSAEQKGERLCLLCLGLDNFSGVNSCYGYQQGDSLLCLVAQRLQSFPAVRYLARSTSDCFLLVLEGKNEDACSRLAEELLENLNEPLLMQGNTFYVGASVGFALLSEGEMGVSTFVEDAEFAMFEAKKLGGNRVFPYKQELRLAALDRKQLETALHKAVDEDGLTVYYQPKIDLNKGDVSGLEALVRWQIGKEKWVPPAVFIPIAEEAGLVTRIDMAVLRMACRQVLSWRDEGTDVVPVAVNMSAHSILSPDFVDRVIGILEEEGTPSSLIDIEITESSFMSDMKKAFEAISRLHKAGLRTALDDFGTGYSSLQYLSAMPFTFLKIDRKFVVDIFSGKATAQPLVKSIISLAANLHMDVIAEGVEEMPQLLFLAANGVNIIQGYLFSKPLSADDCCEYLRTRKERIAHVLNAC